MFILQKVVNNFDNSYEGRLTSTDIFLANVTYTAENSTLNAKLEMR